MDDRMFRNAMGKFATGVTVITTSVDNNVRGMTANAFMSVSLNPKLVLISVGEKAHMNELIKETGKFGVSILNREQQEMSMCFAGQLKENRDIDFEWVGGVPVIKNAIVNLTCDVYNSHRAGDHTLFVGEVSDILMQEGEPLGFYEGKYTKIS
ncbi:flavin reductase (DIM6/NTAB) family NADH-FMN oxidoreductase RutF [Scopulibacillus darangshiensis]|uniref:Flavin reductase (DIM6/NTAB) family NADH-FMN oxidoreductase RutF n=1 Tax=Scopulibacillus darangshiensis TaxID=442528 RepID=A0A4R2P9V3_9BACL|nr:flavin reductase family protein [Scopulibacillus darangshiensis]TCP30861.1 flavin reductase (DIM6/NTAB) family NADH-FMN oxidoreductase RutF [Scopulibacillus darangshiensis]